MGVKKVVKKMIPTRPPAAVDLPFSRGGKPERFALCYFFGNSMPATNGVLVAGPSPTIISTASSSLAPS